MADEPIILDDNHAGLTHLDFAYAGHTGFGNAQQGALAESAVQVETDPIWNAEKGGLMLAEDMPDFGNDFVTHSRMAAEFAALELLLEDMIFDEAPMDGETYVRVDRRWAIYGEAPPPPPPPPPEPNSPWVNTSINSGMTLISVCYGNGKFLAISQDSHSSPIASLISADGINWQEQDVPSGHMWNRAIYGNGLFLVMSGSPGSHFMTSPDAINWTVRPLPNENNWNAIAYGNGLFVAIASSGVAANSRSMYSTDGINWFDGELDAINSWRDIAYGNNRFVAVGNYGAVWRSAMSFDGIHWTVEDGAESRQMEGIAFGDGKFVAITAVGDAMYSVDGLVWMFKNNEFDAPVSPQFLCIRFGLPQRKR